MIALCFHSFDELAFIFANPVFLFFSSSISMCCRLIIRSSSDTLESVGCFLKPELPWVMNWARHWVSWCTGTLLSMLNSSIGSPSNNAKTSSVLFLLLIRAFWGIFSIFVTISLLTKPSKLRWFSAHINSGLT